MSTHFYSKLADQLITEWIEEEIDLDSDTIPNNAAAFSAFSTATFKLSEKAEVLDSPEELPSFDPKFVTKTTVHRLYREINQLDENHSAVLDNFEPDLLIDKISIPERAEGNDIEEEKLKVGIEAQLEFGAPQKFANSFYRIHLANRILPFLTMGLVLIEEYSTELLNSELITDHYQDSNNTIEFLQESLSQPSREQLLQRTGVLEGGDIGKMADIRQTRNDLVHDLRSSDYFDQVVDSLQVVELVADVIEEFEQRLDGKEIDWE